MKKGDDESNARELSDMLPFLGTNWFVKGTGQRRGKLRVWVWSWVLYEYQYEYDYEYEYVYEWKYDYVYDNE